MESNKEIQALISLIDDPDPEVYKHVQQKICSFGEQVIPNLEIVWGNTNDTLLNERIEGIIHNIQFNGVKFQLNKWALEGGKDLLQGALVLNKYKYPDLDISKILTPLQQLRTQIWLELNNYHTPVETANAFNHVIFSKFGFKGIQNYFEEVNQSFLSNVLSAKKGNPNSLSLLYIILAQQLHLPIYGVDLKKHFVICFCKEPVSNFEEKNVNKVLFYVNPFNKGEVFSKNDIEKYLERIDSQASPKDFEPCSHIKTMQCLMQLVVMQSEEIKDEDTIAEMQELIAMLD